LGRLVPLAKVEILTTHGLDLDFLPLKARTSPEWAAVVLADFDAFLLDHAGCERKAAASALSLLSRFSDRPALVEVMTTVAREELEHFAQVYKLIQRRGLRLGPDAKDVYVNHLLKGIRNGAEDHLLDRLIASAFIEARSCERFQVVAESTTEPDIRDFYQTLARSEAGHYLVFVRLAARLFPQTEVDKALARLSEIEALAIQMTPIRAAVH